MYYGWRSNNFIGTFERSWTPNLTGKVFSISVEEGTLADFNSLVLTPTTRQMDLDMGFPEPDDGLLNRKEMDLLYFLQSSFSGIRSSIFHISVTVNVTYYTGLGQVVEEICTARTIVEYPMWYMCSEATRVRYFKGELSKTRGSRYTISDSWDKKDRRFVKRGEVEKSGRVRQRAFRQRPTIPQRQEAPDLFWTIAYAIWGAMDRAVGKLQGRGQEYLTRMPLMNFDIDDITVVQREG
jgi:hypothetical protein